MPHYLPSLERVIRRPVQLAELEEVLTGLSHMAISLLWDEKTAVNTAEALNLDNQSTEIQHWDEVLHGQRYREGDQEVQENVRSRGPFILQHVQEQAEEEGRGGLWFIQPGHLRRGIRLAQSWKI